MLKKILAIILFEILIFSGSGILSIAHTEKNDNIKPNNNYLLDENCNCQSITKTYDINMNSFDYFVMEDPIYIESSIFLNSSKPVTVNIPDNFNWKNFEDQDWTTPAKSQGNCGSCWDFAALGALESIIKIEEENSDLSPDLSEQYVLSCLPSAANHYGEGCRGGTPYKAFYYIKDETVSGNYKNGVIPESCFSYEASHNIPCSDKCDNWENLLVPIKDCSESYLGFDSPENRAIIKSLIYEKGPIAAAMNVTQDFVSYFNFHHDPNDYFPYTEEPWGNRLNHIIVIIGWKNDSNINNGGYWICKNSWGTSWGYDGFFNIEYGTLFTGYYISTVDYDPDSYDWSPTIPIIKGLKEGLPSLSYDYIFKSSDPDGDDDVYYYVDWGDNTHIEWLGPFMSGEEIIINHTWSEKGNYIIRAKAKDNYNEESDWGTLDITIPRNKLLINDYIASLFEHITILKQIINLLI